MSSLSTHVLDTSRGKPASGVPVTLEVQKDKTHWQVLSKSETNSDGRVSTLLPSGTKLESGIYRLTFDTTVYFKSLNAPSFFPYVSIVFEKIEGDERHYHVPLLLNPYGYSTYRGS